MDNKKLIEWYCQNKRELPWRNTISAYHVWLSEIILQQTRVAQGLPYYQKFVATYPNIQDLAQADEQEVLNLWQGLGYYSRARNLHFTAKDIVDNYNGIFPKQYKDLLELKGVGAYTAAAIASFCYNEPVAVLDGNVYRVLSRIFGIEIPINSSEGRKIFKDLVQEQLEKNNPGTYNQAIMEFGALQCTPANPKCKICPLSADCIAFQTGKVEKLPVKIPKAKQKKRYFHYFLIHYKDSIVLQKRTVKDIWQNLYQLPLLEVTSNDRYKSERFDALLTDLSVKTAGYPILKKEVVHKLTHQHLYISFWEVTSIAKPKVLIKISELKNHPMPIVIANFLDNSF